MAAILARLGRNDDAHAVVTELGGREPTVTVGDLIRALPYRRPEDLEAVADALRLAGLPV
jgi:hypothetical protein